MKSLRILTGHHAGVQVPLKKSGASIGSDEECDVQITDWKPTPVVIKINDKQEASLHSNTVTSQNVKVPNPYIEMHDFMPHRFGDIVICVGPVSGVWPSDISILGMLSWPKTITRQRFSPISLTAGSIVAATLVMLSAIASDNARPFKETELRATTSLLAQVENALVASGVNGLAARKVESGVQIDGIVVDLSSVSRVHTALAQVDKERVSHRYVIATDIIRAINDAVGVATVQASYKGAGVFTVTGHTANLDNLLSTIQRVNADFGSRIARIEVDVIEDTISKGKRTLAVMASGGIQYVEGTNGTKHFSMIAPSISENSELQHVPELSPALPTLSRKMEP